MQFTVEDRYTFKLGEAEHRWSFWDGEYLQGRYVSLDTETLQIRGREIPKIVLASASDGQQTVIIRPLDLPAFIEQHFPAARLVFHNIGFDFHALDQYLANIGADTARGWLWSVVDEGRAHDTMLLAALVGLAKEDNLLHLAGAAGTGPSDSPRLPSLAALAKHQLGVELEKDQYRTEYGSIVGFDWEELEPGWFRYPAADALVTFQLYCVLSHQAKAICDQHQASRKFGWLTEQIQIKAAIALEIIGRRGLRVDQTKAKQLIDPLNATIEDCIAKLSEIDEGIFRRYKIKARKGELMLNRSSGLPKCDTKVLKRHFEVVAKEHHLDIKETTRGISDSTKIWHQYRDKAPIIDLWCSYKDAQKQRSFLHELPDRVTSRYNVLVRSGRTSAESYNLQQFDKRCRDVLVADTMCDLLIMDVASAELISLASWCEYKFGFSRLADVLRQGIDPHAYMGSRILGVTYENFLDLKGSDKAKFKKYRALSKAANFGLGGGLGPASFVEYAARPPYEIQLTEDDARRIKAEWVATFPEMRLHLQQTSNGAFETICNQAGRVRGNMTFCQARNFPFQSSIGDAMKLAMWELVKGGFDLVAFIHDEFVFELPRLMQCSQVIEQIESTVIKAMQQVLGDRIPIRLESALCARWSKGAEPVRNEQGELVPWIDVKV